MRSNGVGSIIAVLVALSFPGASEAGNAEQLKADFYVSTDGNDAWSGKLTAPNAQKTDGPFATLERARDALRQVKRRGGELTDMTVLVRGGTYRLSEPLRLGPDDGGAEAYSITYAAYPGEETILSAGRRIDGWKADENGFWATRVPDEDWLFRDLYVNGVRRTRARTPNEGFFRIDTADKSDRTKFTFYEGDLTSRWKNLTDAEIVLFYDWAIARMPLAKVDDVNRTVHFPHPIGYLGLPFTGFCNFDPHQRYWLENAREFVDSPGEWYFDRHTRELVYYPVQGEEIETAEIVAPVLSQLLAVEGTLDRPVRNLHISGLTFSHTQFPLPDVGYGGIQAAHYGSERGAWNRVPIAVELQSAVDCRFERNRLVNLGTTGLLFENGARNNQIVGNEVGHVSGNGIMLGETVGNPKDKRTISMDNTIANNHVHHCGEGYFGSVGIWIGHTQRSRAAHNLVHDMPYTGISMGWTWNPSPTQARENTIEYNHIHHVMQMLADGGGIYTLGLQPDTVIRGNLIHDVARTHGRAASNGMFIDEGSKGYLIEKNVLFNMGDGAFRFNQTTRENHTFKDNILLEDVGPQKPYRQSFQGRQ